MKTKLIIITIIAAVATTAYAYIQCPQCRGSGWDGNLKCFSCGGDGKIGQ
jgi:DnaJ-class molecular chaperone